MTVSSPRVEADQAVVATAFVSDAETPLDQLTYQWSGAPVNGTFTGWPDHDLAGAQAADDAGSLYVEAPDHGEIHFGGAAERELRVVDRAGALQRLAEGNHDDQHAFPDRAVSTYTIPAEQAVADFSDSCSEKASEYNDVANNRNNFQILSGTYTNVSVTPNADRTFADISGTCIFKDIPKDPKNPNVGKAETVTGICRLTAIYENWKWWLCSSHFEGIGVTTSSLRYRVPGRIGSE